MIHALQLILLRTLLVDASNTSNNLNYQLSLATIYLFVWHIINTYRSAAKLFVGGETILSQEGTTQGICLQWPCMHVLALVPLITQLKAMLLMVC